MDSQPCASAVPGSDETAPGIADNRSARPWVSLDVALAGSAATCLLMGWWGLLLVVDGRIVPWPVLAVVLAAAALFVRTRTRPRRAPAVRRVTVAVSGVVLTVGLISSAHASLVDSYFLHPESSSQGCRVVVREESFFLAGGGALYALRGGTGVARRVGEFQTDDGETPFSSGAAGIEWRGEEASVTGPLWLLPGEELDVRC